MSNQLASKLSQGSLQIVRVALSESDQALVRDHVKSTKKRSAGAVERGEFFEAVSATNRVTNYPH